MDGTLNVPYWTTDELWIECTLFYDATQNKYWYFEWYRYSLWVDDVLRTIISSQTLSLLEKWENTNELIAKILRT